MHRALAIAALLIAPQAAQQPAVPTFEVAAGLKLTTGRAPVDVLVIDRVERPTSD